MKKKLFVVLPGVISILLAGGILTVLVFQYFRWEIQTSVRRQLEKDAYVYTGMVINKTNHYLAFMESLKNFFEYSQEVTRAEFAGFTAMQLSEEPGIKAFCWVPRVEASQRDDYQINARKDGLAQFAFHGQTDKPSESCFPVYYAEPMEEGKSLLGCVLDSEPLAYRTIQKAIETGRAASVMNPLKQNSQGQQKAENEYWIMMPVFQQANCEASENSGQRLLGCLVGIVDVPAFRDTVLHDSASEQSPVRFHIEDISVGHPCEFICCGAGFDKKTAQIVSENQFQFADRTWRIHCVVNEASVFHTDYAWMPWLILPVGGLLTSLLVLYLYMLYSHQEKTDVLIERRTFELKEQKEKADVIALEAERSNRAKSAFLAGVSHDIRTPMNVILGFCELLCEESLNPDQKFYVNTIHNNSKNLLTLLNDILDLSKIEAGKLHIDNRVFDPQELLSSVERMFHASAQNRGLDFRIIFMTTVPRLVRSDPLRIRQCLVNLIGNAIKFTHTGHIYVNVSCGNRRLKIAVEDSGIGIAPQRQERIFNAFGPVDSGVDADRECGSGLGLAITRQLALLMEGDVSVQSQEGKGSIFTLDIPAELMEETILTAQDAAGKDGWYGI